MPFTNNENIVIRSTFILKKVFQILKSIHNENIAKFPYDGYKYFIVVPFLINKYCFSANDYLMSLNVVLA